MAAALAKTVKVHEDTHRALKQLKLQGRKASLDEVIRETIQTATGLPVEKISQEPHTTSLTSYTPD
jgi:predicted CopG family antitoxin